LYDKSFAMASGWQADVMPGFPLWLARRTLANSVLAEGVSLKSSNPEEASVA
jgi:hypothetical protein